MEKWIASGDLPNFAKLAKDAKFYEKNGLDVEIILLRGSGQTSQAMIGGSIFASPVTTFSR